MNDDTNLRAEAERQAIEQRKTQRESFLAAIKKAAEEAGFQTSPASVGPKAVGLVIKSDKSQRFEIPVTVREIFSHWSSKVGTNRCSAGQRHGSQQRHWKLFTEATVTKVIAFAKEVLASTVKGEADTKEFQRQQDELNARRTAELKGVVLPPGMRLDIIGGNGPGAGHYTLRVPQYSQTKTWNQDMTLEQAKAVCAFLNGLFGYGKKCVIRKMFPDSEGRPRTYWWNNVPGLMEWVEHLERATLIDDEAAAAATAAAKGGEVLKYDDALQYTDAA